MLKFVIDEDIPRSTGIILKENGYDVLDIRDHGLRGKAVKQYDIEEYETITGKTPFGEWLLNLKDERAQAKIHARIRRASFGNFGDWKDIKGTKGIFEMREHYSPGYRIFYAIIGKRLVLLLAGSTKKDQKKTIAKAKEYLTDYVERTKP